MNEAEKTACRVVTDALLERTVAADLPVIIGGLGDPGVPCYADVATTQVGDLSIVKVRLARRPHPTEGGTFPPSLALAVKEGVLSDESLREMDGFVRDLTRICRRADMLKAAGIDYGHAPLWTFEMDDVTRRLITHSCGGTLDVDTRAIAATTALNITYVPRGWHGANGGTYHADAPLLCGIGDKLRMTEGTAISFWHEVEETLLLEEDEHRLCIRGDRLPLTMIQWINQEHPDVSRVLGHPAFQEECGIPIIDVRATGGWTIFTYERRWVPASPPPTRDAVAWRDI